MALRDKLIPGVFARGLETDKDPKIVSDGLLICENVIQEYQGELKKREGLAVQSTEDTERCMATWKGRPVLIGDKIKASNNAGFAEFGDFGLSKCEIENITGKTGSRLMWCEMGEVSGIRAIAFGVVNPTTDLNEYYIKTYRISTGALLDQIGPMDCGPINLRACSTTGFVWVTCAATGGGYYQPSYGFVYNDGSISSGTYVAGSSNVFAGTQNLHMSILCSSPSGSRSWIMEHITNAGTLEIICQKTNGTTINITNLGSAFCVGTYRYSDTVGIVLYWTGTMSSGTLYGRGYTDTASPTALATTLKTWSSTTLIIYGSGVETDGGASGATRVYVSSATDVSGTQGVKTETCTYNHLTRTVGSLSVVRYGTILLAAPLKESSSVHHVALLHSDFSTTNLNVCDTVLICTSGGVIKQKILPELTTGLHVPSITPYGFMFGQRIGTNQFRFGIDKRTGNDTYVIACCTLTLDSANVNAWQKDDTLLIGNGIPREFCGASAVEQGFLKYPTLITTQRVDTGGSTPIGTGNYGYMALYEWYDQVGNRHQSAPSPVSTAATLANDRVDITVPCLRVTDKNNVSIVIYRTIVEGAIYYRLKTIPNNITVDSITHQDTASDSSINRGEMIYTLGGILENMPPPPYEINCVHQKRHFVVNAEEPSWDIRYSKPFVTFEGAAYNEVLSLACDRDGGNIKALASFVDRLIIFKEKKIYASHGEGYNNLGAGAGYVNPYIISEAVGCRDQRTVIDTPLGLMFDGGTSIYLLDKSLKVSDIGAPAKYWYTQTTLVRAVIVKDKHYVIFFGSGVALVYDYINDFWGTFTEHAAYDAVGGQLYGKDIYHFRETSGNFTHYLMPDKYLNTLDEQYNMRVRTGWFSFAGLSGCQFIRGIQVTGQDITDNVMYVKVAYDEPEFVDTQYHTCFGTYFPSSANYGTYTGIREEGLSIDMATSVIECARIMVEIGNVPTYATEGYHTEEGFSLTGLSFLVSMEDGYRRLGPARNAAQDY